MSQPHQPGCACCTLPSLSMQLDALQHHNCTESLANLVCVAAERAKLALHQDAAIFHGGTIYTLQGGQPSRVEALGIAHGKVVSVGSLQQVETDMRAQPRAERIDLHGKTLLPGMIDPHMHILPSALYRNWINLSPFQGQYPAAGLQSGLGCGTAARRAGQPRQPHRQRRAALADRLRRRSVADKPLERAGQPLPRWHQRRGADLPDQCLRPSAMPTPRR